MQRTLGLTCAAVVQSFTTTPHTHTQNKTTTAQQQQQQCSEPWLSSQGQPSVSRVAIVQNSVVLLGQSSFLSEKARGMAVLAEFA